MLRASTRENREALLIRSIDVFMFWPQSSFGHLCVIFISDRSSRRYDAPLGIQKHKCFDIFGTLLLLLAYYYYTKGILRQHLAYYCYYWHIAGSNGIPLTYYQHTTTTTTTLSTDILLLHTTGTLLAQMKCYCHTIRTQKSQQPML